MQTASLLAEKAAGYIPDEEMSTGGTQPFTKDGEKMHAIVWHGNYDVRYAIGNIRKVSMAGRSAMGSPGNQAWRFEANTGT
jgi:hypothetical protein